MYTPDKLLTLAHWAMGLSLVLALIAVGYGYIWHENTSMHTQLVAHIGLIVLPGVIKLAYVLRLTSLKALHRPVN